MSDGYGVLPPIEFVANVPQTGDELRADLERYGFSGSDLGDACGMTRQKINDYATGRRRITPAMGQRFCDALEQLVADRNLSRERIRALPPVGPPISPEFEQVLRDYHERGILPDYIVKAAQQ